VAACQDRCAQRSSCAAFTFGKTKNNCYLYDAVPRFTADASFDSGVRQSLQTPVQSRTPQPSAQQAAAGSFEIRRNMDASGVYYYMKNVASIGECEQVCKEAVKCLVFTYSKGTNACFLYDKKAGFSPNDRYDTGIRP